MGFEIIIATINIVAQKTLKKRKSNEKSNEHLKKFRIF